MTTPLWIQTPLLGGAVLSAVNTAVDGSGTLGSNIFLVAGLDQAGTVYPNGGYIEHVSFMPGLTAPGSTVACLVRLFESSQLTPGGSCTSANTKFIRETPLPLVTVSVTAPVPPIGISLKKILQKGTGILATVSLAQSAGNGWHAVPWGFGAY